MKYTPAEIDKLIDNEIVKIDTANAAMPEAPSSRKKCNDNSAFKSFISRMRDLFRYRSD